MQQLYPEIAIYSQKSRQNMPNYSQPQIVEDGFVSNRGGRGPRKIRFQEGRRKQDSTPTLKEENNFEAAFESEHSNENYIPEYMRFEEFDEEETFAPKPIKPVHYMQRTFDDDSNSSSQDNDTSNLGGHQRRGPKIIKFKQKKHSERLAMSQLKNDSDQDKADILDLYTPKN